MKIFIYCRPRNYTTEETLRRFMYALEQSGMPFVVNEEYVEFVESKVGLTLPGYARPTQEDLDKGAIMISVGGDGTFLDAVRNLRGLPMPIVGVNAGRLGFLAGVAPGDFAEALEIIKEGNYTIEKRSMLTVEGDFPVAPDFPYALNEFTLHRHTADMVEVTAFCDGNLLATMRGDGSIVCTPTGSTAYSLSAGGPIVAPDCQCFVLSAIAPHNFSIRPLVLPDTSVIELQVRTRGQELLASLDNSSFIVGDGARFRITKSKYSTFLAQLQNISYYDTLRDRVMWGLDKRDKTLPLHP